MKKPHYVAPNNQRDGYQQPPVYAPPETFEHALGYVRPKDTKIPVIDVPMHDPIPVKVVDMPRGPERVLSFVGTNFNVPPSGDTLKISRNDNRQRLLIVNNDVANPVYIKEAEGQSSNFPGGYPLLPGKDLTIRSTREVFIYNPHASAVVNVGVFYEMVAELA